MPVGLELKSRPLELTIPDDIPRHWNDNDAAKSHFLNAFSCLLPAFEQIFISIVKRRSREVSDPQLKNDLVGFCSQEGSHASIHRKYNRFLIKQGYSFIPVIEKFHLRCLKDFQKFFPQNFALALTAGAEHITSVWCHDYLSSPEKWSLNAHPALLAVWTWHSIEELEHKAVCFDLYQTLSGNRFQRILAMLFISTYAMMMTTIVHISLLAKDGELFKIRTWMKYGKMMYIKNGFMRNFFRAQFEYFAKDFHPWKNSDDLQLIRFWEAK